MYIFLFIWTPIPNTLIYIFIDVCIEVLKCIYLYFFICMFVYLYVYIFGFVYLNL